MTIAGNLRNLNNSLEVSLASVRRCPPSAAASRDDNRPVRTSSWQRRAMLWATCRTASVETCYFQLTIDNGSSVIRFATTHQKCKGCTRRRPELRLRDGKYNFYAKGILSPEIAAALQEGECSRTPSPLRQRREKLAISSTDWARIAVSWWSFSLDGGPTSSTWILRRV